MIRANHTQSYGLSSSFKDHKECRRCGLPLLHSRYEGQRVAFSCGNSPKAGFKCIRCSITKTTHKLRQTVTEEEVKEFLNEIKIKVLIPKVKLRID